MRPESEVTMSAIKIIAYLVIPAILFTILLGGYVLLAFGIDYYNEGLELLRLFAISTIFISINSIGNAVFYVRFKVKLIILANTVGTVTILMLSALLVDYGLMGIGIAWIIGQAIISAIYLISIRKLL